MITIRYSICCISFTVVGGITVVTDHTILLETFSVSLPQARNDSTRKIQTHVPCEKALTNVNIIVTSRTQYLLTYSMVQSPF
jgi:hypothetical protein